MFEMIYTTVSRKKTVHFIENKLSKSARVSPKQRKREI